MDLAAAKGLVAISVTDHDTSHGLERARARGNEVGVYVLSGVEISVSLGSRTVHMLGYRYDAGATRLQTMLDEMIRLRNERNALIVEKLNSLGIPVTVEEIMLESGGTVVGRPHIARVLVRHGAVGTLQEAFDKYLSGKGLAYVPREQFSPADAVAMIREAGGVAVLAHPKLINLPEGQTLEDLLRELKDVGLAGIECYYSLHSRAETMAFSGLADKFGLIKTGGSDYHGANKPTISLGTGLGDLRVSANVVQAILDAA